MSKRNNVFFILAIVGGILFSPLLDHTQAFAQVEIPDKIKKLCESKYDSYKKIGKENFEKTYANLTYLQNCFLLFDDPAWTFNGKEKIDRHYEKYYAITSQVNPLINNYENQKLGIDKISFNKIGYQNYALKIRICAGDKIVSEPKLFVISDKEYFLAKSSRDLKENSCGFVMAYANSYDPEKIKLLPFDGNYMPSKYLKVKLVY